MGGWASGNVPERYRTQSLTDPPALLAHVSKSVPACGMHKGYKKLEVDGDGGRKGKRVGGIRGKEDNTRTRAGKEEGGCEVGMWCRRGKHEGEAREGCYREIREKSARRGQQRRAQAHRRDRGLVGGQRGRVLLEGAERPRGRGDGDDGRKSDPPETTCVRRARDELADHCSRKEDLPIDGWNYVKVMVGSNLRTEVQMKTGHSIGEINQEASKIIDLYGLFSDYWGSNDHEFTILGQLFSPPACADLIVKTRGHYHWKA